MCRGTIPAYNSLSMGYTASAARYKNKKELIQSVVGPHDKVLDIGFWGQANTAERDEWPHRIILDITSQVWGVDLTYDENAIPDPRRYQRASAENFSFTEKFTVIIALDLIEHIPNPGLFLERVERHLAPGGRLILSTPNAFNLFVIAGKFSRIEPPVNRDHVAYYNRPTIQVLLAKCGWSIERFGFIYTLGDLHRESLKKKILNLVYYLLSQVTDKFYETLVIIARPQGQREEHLARATKEHSG